MGCYAKQVLALHTLLLYLMSPATSFKFCLPVLCCDVLCCCVLCHIMLIAAFFAARPTSTMAMCCHEQHTLSSQGMPSS